MSYPNRKTGETMILLGYAAGVVLLWCCLRRKSERLRSAVFMA